MFAQEATLETSLVEHPVESEEFPSNLGIVNPVFRQSTNPPCKASRVTADVVTTTANDYDDDGSFVHPMYGPVPPRSPVSVQANREIWYNSQQRPQQQQVQPQVAHIAYNYALYDQMHQQQLGASQIELHHQPQQQQPEQQQLRALQMGPNNKQQLQYAQQQQQQQAVAILQPHMNDVTRQDATEPAPRDFMFFAAFVTLCCCTLLGVLAMWQAAASRVALAKGNVARANFLSRKALGLSLVSLSVTVLAVIITVVVVTTKTCIIYRPDMCTRY